VYDGDLAALVQRLGDGRTLVVTLAEPSPAIHVAGTTVVEVEGPRQRLRFEGNPAEVIAAIVRDHAVVDLTIEEPSVEQVISRLYRGVAG
jgi:ABC-2 type transport system ATP-binding protein